MNGDWKLAIGFMADILYIKGIICAEEMEAIQEVQWPMDLQRIVEKMLRGEFNVYKRGATVLGDYLQSE